MINRVNRHGFPKVDHFADKHKLFQFEFGNDTDGIALLRFDLDLYTEGCIYALAVSMVLSLGKKAEVHVIDSLDGRAIPNLKFSCRGYSRKKKNPGFHVGLKSETDFKYRISNVDVYEPTKSVKGKEECLTSKKKQKSKTKKN